MLDEKEFAEEHERIWRSYCREAAVDPELARYREYTRTIIRTHPDVRLRADLTARYIQLANESGGHYQFLITRRRVIVESLEWLERETSEMRELEWAGWEPAKALIAGLNKKAKNARSELVVIDAELLVIKPEPASADAA